MRVNKKQIVNGLAAYIRETLIPVMGNNKGLQVALDVAVGTLCSNDKLLDTVFASPYVKALIQEDSAGTYEIGMFMEMLRASVEEHGELPINVPSIPLIAPGGGVITLRAPDIAAIRRSIEGTGGGNDNA